MSRRTHRTRIGAIYRLMRRYRCAHGRLPSLFRPRRFSEKIQWRKLFDRHPLYEVLCDKLACRDYVEARLGPGQLTPLLWSGEDPSAMPLEQLREPYIVKCAHGSGMNVFVDAPALADFASIRARVSAWQAHNYGRAAQEPGYAPVRPRLLIEPLLTEDDGSLPVEYKFFLFDGRVELIMVRINGDHDTHSNWFMRADGSPVDARFDAPKYTAGGFEPPRNFDAMLAIAERLGAGFDHIRVDLLVVRGRIYVGELTVYSFSGMSPSEPAGFDLELGHAWRIEAPFRRALLALLGMARPWRRVQ